MAQDTKKPRRSLSDDAITSRRGVSRRSLLLGALGGGALASTASIASAASDSDSGSYADPAGRGRSGLTDNDNGSYADAAGRGRGASGRYTGITDRDDGSVQDRAGYGRGGT
ncbi:MAG: hypothetical protein Kow0013_11910 [Pararhodobacter sp.]